MAARWRLREATLSRRQPYPIATPRVLSPPPSSSSSASSSPSSSPPPWSFLPASAEESRPPHCLGPLLDKSALFHCRECWAVLGDSLQLCAEEEQHLGLLVCLRVTEDVVWEDSLMVGIQGALLGCAYYVLTCQSCGSPVGFILYSAPSSLAYLRGLFCFLKGNILCYFLKNQVVIEASMVNFPAVTLKEQVEELKQRVVNAYTRIELLMEKVEELYQNINVAERQSSTLDAGDLRTEHAIVRIN